ncbi:MAG: hypothetical protein ACREN7_02330 [Candidatus Dormibacteria bacterium]
MSRIRVRAETPRGRPQAVDLGRGWVDVTAVAERWRVEVGWWRAAPEQSGLRDCWRVLLKDGACLDLRFAPATGRWRLERRWG